MVEKKLVLFVTYVCSLSYIFLYINTKVSFVLSIIALLAAFIKVIFSKKYDLEIYLILMLFNHVITPAIGQNSNILWNLSIISYKYVLFFIIVLKVLLSETLCFNKNLEYSLSYCIMLFLWSLYDFDISKQLILRRILPLFFFLLYLIFKKFSSGKEIFDIELIGKVLKVILIVSVITYFIPHYSTITKILFESGFLYQQPVLNVQYTLFGSLNRNMGIVFDARFLGIIAYIYLFLILNNKNCYSLFNMALAIFVTISSYSRGGIIAFSLIFIGYLYNKYSSKRMVFISVFIFMSLIVAVISVNSNLLPKAGTFLGSFNIFGDRNVFDQRKILRDMATREFYKSPVIGNGVGWVTSRNNTVLAEETYTTATDAYYNVLLAEVGFLGLLVFLASTLEIFNFKDRRNIFFALGFLIHLSGTNIPDAGSDYIYILFLIYGLTLINRSKKLEPHVCIESNI